MVQVLSLIADRVLVTGTVYVWLRVNTPCICQHNEPCTGSEIVYVNCVRKFIVALGHKAYADIVNLGRKNKMLARLDRCKPVEHSYYDFNRQFRNVLTVNRLTTV